MAVQFIEVYWTKEGTTNEILVNDIIDWNTKKGIEAKQNFFKVNLRNVMGVKNNALKRKFINPDGTLKFSEGDTLKLYYDEEAITKTASQLYLNGIIHEIGGKVDNSGRNTITVNARDRTYLLLNKLWSKNYPDAVADQAHEVIIAVIKAACRIEDGSGYYITTDNVATTQSDESAFPTMETGDVPGIALVFKTLYEWIQTLSQTDYTGEDRGYIFWVDDSNDLHWIYPNDTAVETTLEEGKGNIIGFNGQKSAEGRINMVIYTAGKDKVGNTILWYYFDPEAKTKQFTFKFQPMEDISRDYRKDLEDARSTLNEGAALTVDDATITLTSGTDFSSSGTIRIDSEMIDYTGKSTNNLTGCTRGVDGTPAAAHDDGSTVIEETTFAAMSNSDYRTNCQNRADERAKAIIQRYGGLRWKFNVSIKGKCNFNIGDLVENTFPSLGFQALKLRIHDISFVATSQEIAHVISLEEDAEAISS